MYRRRAGLVFSLLLVVALLTACGGTTTPEKVDSGTESSSAESTAPERFAVGDTVKMDEVDVKLNAVKKLKNTDFDKPMEKGNKFVAVDVTITNNGTEPTALSSVLQFSLKDSDGYAASQTFHSKAKSMPEGELAPGSKASGQIVYEVPKDATGLEVVFDASLLGSGQAIWDVGDAADL